VSNPWEATELFGKMLGEYTDNGYRQGVYEERERIIQLLQVMRNDLASCIKDDDCLVRADAIDVCISDIKGEDNA